MIAGKSAGFLSSPREQSMNRIVGGIRNEKHFPKRLSKSSTIMRKGMWTEDGEIEGPDRIKACVPYLLPLIDGHHFAKYLCLRFPIIGAIDSVTIGPLADVFDTIPLASFTLFLVLSLGTRNPEMNRSLRFSAQQAVLIDVTLILPELFTTAFGGSKEFQPLFEPASNFTSYYYLTCCMYSIAQNLRGKKPDNIPYISNLAQIATGPF